MLDDVKFLLVDDIEENLVALAALLRRDGLQVLTARSGTEALELLLEHDFALAMIDVRMPGMDGFQLAELMRGAERSKRVPIIFVTASSEEAHRVFRGYETGAVDFLFKPVDPNVMRHKADTFFQLHRQRQQLSEQLRRIQESESLLRGILDSTSACIYVKEVDGRYITLNRSCEHLLGIPLAELRGRTDHEIFPREIADPLRMNDLRVLEKGERIEFEERVRASDGSPRTFLTSKVPLRDEEERVWAVCGISTDITERKRLEDDLERAVQAREHVLAVVSHDLRNPLGVISLCATLLQESALTAADERARQQCDRLERASEHMTRMIGDLLDTASIQAGRLAVKCGVQDASALVGEALAAHAHAAQEKGIRLEPGTGVLRGMGEIWCDRGRILQVFANLIGNALKFSPRGSRIAVEARRSGEHVQFSVVDSGPGISAHDLPHLFAPYWSGKQHENRGTGLGLCIAKGIVDAHGGSIWVTSNPGSGSAFHFTLRRPELANH